MLRLQLLSEKNNMNSETKLIVITPMLSEEFESYFEEFKKTYFPAIELINSFVTFVLIIQGKSLPNADLLKSLTDIARVEPIFTDIRSTSRGRNLGIDFVLNNSQKAESVIFLDSDSFISTEDWLSIQRILDENPSCIHEISVQWLPTAQTSDSIKPTINKQKNTLWQNRMFRTYLWSLIIPLRFFMQNRLKFDENLGPGEHTIFKSGEDTIFLLELFQKNSIKTIVTNSQPRVLHPHRPLDNSKRKIYALGQGNLFKLLLRKTTDRIFFTYLLGWLLLFIANTLFMVIMLKPNAVLIAKLRLKGLLSTLNR